MSIKYEWDVEEHDDVDVLDHDHRDKLSDFKKLSFSQINGVEFCLVLVKDVGNQDEGLQHRAWAYTMWDRAVERWVLPGCFDDGSNVPKKFHDELKARCEDNK